MATAIMINGNTLQTPDGNVYDCWEDRATGLLSRAAGLALMPYMNEAARVEAEYERIMGRLEYGDPAAPHPPAALYEYFVDGEQAIPAAEVRREQSAIWMNDGEPTGRIYMSTMSDLLKLLGAE